LNCRAREVLILIFIFLLILFLILILLVIFLPFSIFTHTDFSPRTRTHCCSAARDRHSPGHFWPRSWTLPSVPSPWAYVPGSGDTPCLSVPHGRSTHPRRAQRCAATAAP